ncbi:hypothetical protein M9H77_03945 [Catharanthus roseus]|uniref:Uncharacterized protein n=1 Tax=Catharanthus roseus TaxID=4058 RepID=A0ACC0CCP6_CATRO|nr:hypothetical protein M9H77_03945 [Catharanthus roseus]
MLISCPIRNLYLFTSVLCIPSLVWIGGREFKITNFLILICNQYKRFLKFESQTMKATNKQYLMIRRKGHDIHSSCMIDWRKLNQNKVLSTDLMSRRDVYHQFEYMRNFVRTEREPTPSVHYGLLTILYVPLCHSLFSMLASFRGMGIQNRLVPLLYIS